MTPDRLEAITDAVGRTRIMLRIYQRRPQPETIDLAISELEQVEASLNEARNT